MNKTLLLIAALGGFTLLSHEAKAQTGTEIKILNPCRLAREVQYSDFPQPTKDSGGMLQPGNTIMILGESKVVRVPPKSYIRTSVNGRWVELGRVDSKGQSFTVICK